MVNVGAVTQSGAVNYSNLILGVTGPVTLTGNNDVTNLAASVSGAGNGFSFNDVDDLYHLPEWGCERHLDEQR